MKHPDDNPNREIGEGYALVSVGITFAVVLTGATLGGLWLDHRLGTTPLLTLVGMVAGGALGGFWLWQRIKGSGHAGK